MTGTDDEHPAQRLKVIIRSVTVLLGIINPSPIEKISMKLRSSLSCSGRHKTDRANYQIHAGSYG